MPLPTLNDVRPVNPVLTNLSFGFKNDKFLWDKIAPFVREDQKSGTYFIYTRDFWFRRQTGGKRAPNGPYTRADYGVSTATYNALERGFEKSLDEPTRKASQTPEDLQRMDVAFLTNLMQLELEKDVAAAAFVTGVWGTSTTLASTATTDAGKQWSDFNNSDPIQAAKIADRVIHRNTGAHPNSLFIGRLAWESLSEHPLILEKYKYTQKGIMTPELVAAVLNPSQSESMEITVGDTVENTAADGQTFVGADVWTDSALFVVRNNPALGVANGAYTFIWDEKGHVPWAVDEYRDDKIRANVSRVFTHYDIKIVSAQHGYIYLDCN